MITPALFPLNLKYGFELKFDEENHAYTIDGIFTPGVTTVLDLFPKKALVPWAAKMTSEAIAGLLAPNKAYKRSEIEDICKEGKLAWRKKKDAAAQTGTMAHNAIEKYIKTGEMVIPDIKEVQNSIEAFLTWEKVHTVAWIASEVRVASKEYMFAGTLDAFAVIDGHLSLVDFKTSAAIYESMYIQTAAYKLCLHEGKCDPFEKRYILRFPKDGSGFEAREVPTSYLQDKNTFLSALDFWKNLRQYEDYKK